MGALQRAAELYAEGHVHDALKVAQVACEVRPKDADSWWLLGQVTRHAGLTQASDDAFRRAAELSPDRPLPTRVSEAQFRILVEDARAELAGDVGSGRAGVRVEVRPLPAEELVQSGVAPDALVHVSGPGHIVLFQANLENGSRSAEELAERVRAVLRETAAG
jgi:tetratricopeptide (TPR) repeat protein